MARQRTQRLKLGGEQSWIMIQIPLESIPNQNFTINIDNVVFDISLWAVNSGDTQIMAMDILADNEPVVLGQRLVSGQPVLPYRYLANYNFILITNNEELPAWQEFQVSQFLIYVGADEL